MRDRPGFYKYSLTGWGSDRGFFVGAEWDQYPPVLQFNRHLLWIFWYQHAHVRELVHNTKLMHELKGGSPLISTGEKMQKLYSFWKMAMRKSLANWLKLTSQTLT